MKLFYANYSFHSEPVRVLRPPGPSSWPYVDLYCTRKLAWSIDMPLLKSQPLSARVNPDPHVSLALLDVDGDEHENGSISFCIPVVANFMSVLHALPGVLHFRFPPCPTPQDSGFHLSLVNMDLRKRPMMMVSLLCRWTHHRWTNLFQIQIRASSFL